MLLANEKKQRDHIIDVARGLCILLMVVGHCNHFFDYNSAIMTLIYGFHMPCFIYLSGAALSLSQGRVSLKEFFVKRFNSLVVPYFVGGVISIILFFLFTGEQNPQFVGALLAGEARTTSFDFNLPLWFLPMLFLSQIVFYATIILSKDNAKLQIPISLTLSVIGYFLCKSACFTIWNCDIALFAQLFVCLGYWTYRYFTDVCKKMSPKFLLLTVFVLIVVYCVLSLYNTRVDMNARNYKNIGLYILNSFLGISIMLIVAYLLQHIRLISAQLCYIGRNSLGVLCWHLPSSTMFYSYVLGFFPSVLHPFLWGQHSKLLAIIVLLLFVIPVSITIHHVVFESK